MASYYCIEPTVLEDGTRTWALWRHIPTIMGTLSSKIAANVEKAVLERAIEHLRQPQERNPS